MAQKKKGAKKSVTKKNVIVASPVDPSVQLVVASELADDRLIEQELTGEALPFYIYQFTQEGKVVSGLSVRGVSETVRQLNRDTKSGYKIRVNPQYLKVERDVVYNGEKGVEVSVYVENLVDGNSAWGIKFEPYQKVGRNGRYPNTFAVEKALSKAERNGKRKLIPETVVVKMIEKLIKQTKGAGVQTIDAPQYQVGTAMPAPAQASTPSEMENIVRSAIAKAKTAATLMKLDENVQGSKMYSKQFKEEVHKLCSAKADTL